MHSGTLSIGVLITLALVPCRAAPVGEAIAAGGACESNTALVGPCFTIEGRALYTNGTPGFRIVRTGTRRVLGVVPSENEIVPACLAKAVTPTSEVSGEFRVCPFSVEKAGHMQMVCVQSVGAFTVKRWMPESKTYVTSGPTPGCSLPTGTRR
jgi:hypothetical protein